MSQEPTSTRPRDSGLRWLAVILACVVLGQLLARSHGSGGPKPGTPLPEVSLPTLGGPPLTSASLKGGVTVLNFWATWCPACREELPELAAFARKQGQGCVRLVGLSDEDPETLRAFPGVGALGYPLASGAGGLERSLDIQVLPTTVVLDPEGRVAARHEGALDARELEELVRPLRAGPRC